MAAFLEYAEISRMRQSDFRQVDVFTTTPFQGNPVAVVMDATGLTDKQMQAIANWTNLSETTFVFPRHTCDADYHVRIFTPRRELPFAGHPTIGTAFALLEAGVISATNGQLLQSCKAGIIPLRVSNDAPSSQTIAFAMPATSMTPLNAAQQNMLSAALGCELVSDTPAQLVDAGPRWIVAQLDNHQSVGALSPDFQALQALDNLLDATGTCVFGYDSSAVTPTISVRAFAPSCGIPEDPVCGSGNGCVAAFIRHFALPGQASGEVFSRQGHNVGRNGNITLSISESAILVAGQAVTSIQGCIAVPEPE
ncbi:PhzF family phenazine biosynthesis protein [Alteromonas sp. H39]|uniref:PhzF family phenazine biosynthesis protein n=1 Tax=Alteromonas sp. H39 TaxID=3389876 RepID=UPI0039E14421